MLGCVNRAQLEASRQWRGVDDWTPTKRKMRAREDSVCVSDFLS